MELDIIDVSLRGSATGICLILGFLLWSSRIARDAQIAFTFLIITLVARLWSTLPSSIEVTDQALQVMRTIGCAGAFAMTWFAMTIFLDNKRFSWAWLASSSLISVCIFLAPRMPEITPYLRGFAVVHFAGLLAMVLYSGLDDLQDARRRMRPAMSTFLFIYCIGLAITSRPMQDTRTIEAALFQSGGLLFFLTCFALWALKTNMNHWPGETAPTTALEPSVAQESSEQTALVKRIHKEMAAGIWKIEGLTVAALAQQVNAPEHQVRKAINQVLGHRNFASFINRARIDAAMSRLSMPEEAKTTILEISYDVGFSSVGPFNRAFREATGQSPTDFRKQALYESAV